MSVETLKQKLADDGIFTYPIDVPLSDGLLAKIEKAMDVLYRIAEWECDCHSGECTDEAPQCEPRKARLAYAELEAAVSPVHRTLNPDRAGSASEAIYLSHWQKQQERKTGWNNGYGLLELLLSPTRQDREQPWSVFGRKYVPHVSQRDAEVAATVIQWLGTSCGRGFIYECEQQCETAGHARHALEAANSRLVFQRHLIPPNVHHLALHAAAYGLRGDHPRHAELVQKIEAAIVSALNAAKQETAGAT